MCKGNAWMAEKQAFVQDVHSVGKSLIITAGIDLVQMGL